MTRLKAVYQTCFALSIALWASPTLGHEFWIDPVDPSVAPGDEIVADNRVGENLKGSGMIYNPNSFTQFVMIDPDGARQVEGRMGDRPALSMTAGPDGLHIISHMTTANKLKYAKFKKFQTFVETHGQAFAVARHEALGLPKEDFTEAYFRCAKALVKVGSGEGKDRATGMPFELVALTNPYTTDGAQRFVLLYKGKPKPNHQVDVFRRPAEAEDVVMSSLQTDALGEMIVPRESGEIMLNAVVLEEPRPSMAEKLDAVWVSLWASTTYTIED